MTNIINYRINGEEIKTDYDEILDKLNTVYQNDNGLSQLKLIYNAIGGSVVKLGDFYDIVWAPFYIRNIGPNPLNSSVRNYFNNNRSMFCQVERGFWCTTNLAKIKGYKDNRYDDNNENNKEDEEAIIKQDSMDTARIVKNNELSDGACNDSISLETVNNKYTRADFLKDVFIDESHYNHLVELLRNKKNIILQGAPGVGKTFAAMRLAWSMMGEQDNDRIEFIQFHQNYSYEDFIMGYKPVKDGFELKEGVFYRFCKKAEKSSDKEFFFIIDEINRGNMSKIFGELLMLIENNYRGMEITLAYRNERFSVPKNLYIIGMMNTADRSLAMIDYALRRRFSFFEMEPGFDSKGFTQYLNGLKNDTLKKLISVIKALNQEIPQDKSLGKGFCIGHSYVSNLEQNCTEDRLRSIVDYDILPMLNEYWFDDDNKYNLWKNQLQEVFER